MSDPRYRSVLVEFHDGETKSIVVDRHEGVRVLRRFAIRYDRYEFPDLVASEFRRLDPK